MDYFLRRDGELYAEELPLNSLAQRFGTPLFVYSRATLERHYRAYADSLGPLPGMICYAVKANSNLAILNLLARLGAGFDIVSGGELERVLMAGGDPKRIVFSGVGKTAAEMERALEVGVHCFNVESVAELHRLQAVAQHCAKRARISLRVNPDVDAKTHPYISTGLKENKFGVDFSQAFDIYQQAKNMSHLDIIGLDCHIGSQLTEIKPFMDALDRLLALVDQLQDSGIELEHLDLGGGLGVTYRDEQPPHPSVYINALASKLAGRNLGLILEPGRSIVANAGVLLTKVEYLKQTPHKHFAIIDAAMNDNIRPALYQAWLNIETVQTRAGDPVTYDLVGPVCETADFLGKDRSLVVDTGDYLCVRSCGAYSFAMSSNYNSRTRAAEVMVDGDQAHLVRERETFADLVRGETLLPQ